MASLWFVVPAHGRVELARICLRQLRRTCDTLHEHGVEATAVVVADDENLATARELGFATIPRNNRSLSRKFNDGIQLALDRDINPRPADYVVPCGSDDFVHPGLFTSLPDPDAMHAFQWMSFVREDGQAIAASHISYTGGCGIRIYPRQVMEPLGYRPADEDRSRGCDTSILANLRQEWADGMRIQHFSTDARWIVDWKSPAEQINSFDAVKQWQREQNDDPFAVLAGVYPDEALAAMQAHYGRVPVAA